MTHLRDDILAEARACIGTPYRHQASLRGAGCDCLGLVRGVWRAVIGTESETPPCYTPDWAERGGGELLHAAASRALRSVAIADAQPADVLLFRMRDGAPMKHVAILSTPDHIIHAYWGRAVVESALVPFWRDRIAAAFVFPGA